MTELGMLDLNLDDLTFDQLHDHRERLLERANDAEWDAEWAEQDGFDADAENFEFDADLFRDEADRVTRFLFNNFDENGEEV